EYTWLRSLSSDAHKGAFGTFPPLKEPKLDIEYGAVSAGSLFPSEGRYRAYGLPEHPGGQIPVVTDTLQEVELLIYLQAEERVLEKLRQALLEPTPREIPHLGRAEDMIILEEVGTVPLERKEVPPGRYPYSFWVPYTEAKQLDMEGLIYRISLKGEDTLTGRRVTSTEVILWEGEAPYRLPVYWDGEKKLPVFLHLL
ncbi:MAG: hypothetical protein N2170_08730, partial [Bacteroidia bacterium]|nr:hypothetical protein [Bacteroidia bacterium]